MKTKRIITILALIFLVVPFLMGSTTMCSEADKVSQNISLEADNFNVTRTLTVINTRAEDGNNAILFQMTGNFSITKEEDGDLAVTGENPDGTYYKHFVYLTRDISYITEQIESSSVNKHKYEINFNPKMIIPVTAVNVD
jgi:hypothetical protein